MPEAWAWWAEAGLILAGCVAAGGIAGYLSRAGRRNGRFKGDGEWPGWPH